MGRYEGEDGNRTQKTQRAPECCQGVPLQIGGDVTAYALDQLSNRGVFFVNPTHKVYPGQVVGEQVKDGDLVVQVCRKKHLTNMRASTAEKGVVLTPPRELTIETAIEWINDDELVEVTPARGCVNASSITTGGNRPRAGSEPAFPASAAVSLGDERGVDIPRPHDLCLC